MSNYKPSSEATRRNEIRDLVNKIPDSETLLFCLWMFKKIANHKEFPRPEKLKDLRDAFMRIIDALRHKKTIRQEDLTLVLRYTDASGLDLARPLAATVRYLREKRHLTRREVSRLSGFPAKWLIALERGQVQDLSLPEFARLAKGFGLDAVGFMEELEKRLDLRFDAD